MALNNNELIVPKYYLLALFVPPAAYTNRAEVIETLESLLGAVAVTAQGIFCRMKSGNAAVVLEAFRQRWLP